MDVSRRLFPAFVSSGISYPVSFREPSPQKFEGEFSHSSPWSGAAHQEADGREYNPVKLPRRLTATPLQKFEGDLGYTAIQYLQNPREAMSAGDANAAVRVFSLCSKQACRLDFFVTFLVKQKSTEENYDPVIARFFSPDKYVANSSFTQDFNRYSYARNNPLMYTDPDGEFIHFIIGAVVGFFQGMVTGAQIASAKGLHGWAKFGYMMAAAHIGGGIGAATAGIGGAMTNSLTAVGISGAAAGAIVGGTTGVVSGATTGLAMGALAGMKGNELGKAVGMGALNGLISGVVMGGLIGGIESKMKGERFWLGGTKSEFGSSQPISASPQEPRECQLESMVAISNSNCDNFSETDLRSCLVKNSDGYTYDRSTWENYGKLSGYQVQQDNVLTQTEFTKRFMAGDRISINLDQGVDVPGHTVTAADIYGTKIIRVNGTVVYRIGSIKVMNPASFSNGGYDNLQWYQIRSDQVNKFFIRL